jgi:hypothetical protein
MGNSFEETMPMTKLYHPMTSCDSKNLWMMCGRFRAVEHSEQVR